MGKRGSEPAFVAKVNDLKTNMLVETDALRPEQVVLDLEKKEA